MSLNFQKSEFSYAYIYAIASTAGYSFLRTTTPLDNLGIDIIITGIGVQGIMNFPQLYIQLKCTSRDLFDENYLKYPLKIKNYEELRTSNQYPPLLLIIIVVPDSIDEWLKQSEQELCLRNCAYWISLSGADPTENQGNITIFIPKTNIFTPNVLKNLMQRISMGENI